MYPEISKSIAVPVHRRTFFKAAAAGAGLALAGKLLDSPSMLPGQSRGTASRTETEPGCVFLRDVLGEEPTMTLDDFIRLCMTTSNGTELTSYYFPRTSTKST